MENSGFYRARLKFYSLIACLCPVALLFLESCTTMSVTPLTTASAGSYELHQQNNGLAVSVQPMTDETQIEDMFKVNLLEKGTLPILVVVENQSSASSFIVAKEPITVTSEASPRMKQWPLSSHRKWSISTER